MQRALWLVPSQKSLGMLELIGADVALEWVSGSDSLEVLQQP